MSECTGHSHDAKEHNHDHGPNCGHTAIEIDGMVCYVHDGHMHRQHGNHVHCESIEFSADNPDGCTPNHSCDSHDKNHVHTPGCGHEQVPHGDHVDYLVEGHLHHPHGGHCDDHGKVKVVKKK